MKTKTILISAISSYFLFLVFLIPAANIIPLFNTPSSGVKLYGISGSLWTGRIDQVMIKKQRVQSVNWSLNLLAILTANLSADLEADFQGQPVSTQLSYSLISNTATLSNLHSSVNASDLNKILNIPFGQLSGIIKIDFDNVQLNTGKLPLVNGQVKWNNAKLTLGNTTSFGQLLLTLNSNEAGDLLGVLSNTQGELSIAGDIKVLANQKYTLNIKLTPRANASNELKNILSLIAPRKVKSSHIIQRSGYLRSLGINL
jgi:general secretion pathway protein N